jgi:hypothetical protein
MATFMAPTYCAMEAYIESARKQFEYYKMLGEKTLTRLDNETLNRQYNSEMNSVATIVRHLHGNMMSRWTNFLVEDGEKPWRNRDAEFDPSHLSPEAAMALWAEGWLCLFDALRSIKPADYNRIVYIRNQGHSITDAINRQLCHYAYHVGQMVLLGKLILADRWESLSIPRGGSRAFNADHFAKAKEVKHFTDEFLQGDSSEHN